MIPDVNELDTSIVDAIVADLEGFERNFETPINPKSSKWQWLLDAIKTFNERIEP
ncbi:MAG: hypothetical protein LBI18_10730 [Planctomycetaceae bacterium]|jgi:hypothetical protein|nr:hypothetical protein [Planctomycetaceae bacterium]